jgi:hypothetical protein
MHPVDAAHQKKASSTPSRSLFERSPQLHFKKRENNAFLNTSLDFSRYECCIIKSRIGIRSEVSRPYRGNCLHCTPAWRQTSAILSAAGLTGTCPTQNRQHPAIRRICRRRRRPWPHRDTRIVFRWWFPREICVAERISRKKADIR